VVARMLLVGAGGFLGAVLRYVVGVLALRALPPTFPFGTFFVNVSGCFAIGVLGALFEDRAVPLGPRLFWMAGVLGGYTTFSTFGYETVSLLGYGSTAAAWANVAGQVLLGLCAVWAGAALVRGWA
jgi:fluoride exporter